MLDKLTNWIKKLIADETGNSPCIAKIIGSVSVVAYFGYAGVGLHSGHFDMEGFAHGLMDVLLGAGGLIAGKQLTTRRPDAP